MNLDEFLEDDKYGWRAGSCRGGAGKTVIHEFYFQKDHYWFEFLDFFRSSKKSKRNKKLLDTLRNILRRPHISSI